MSAISYQRSASSARPRGVSPQSWLLATSYRQLPGHRGQALIRHRSALDGIDEKGNEVVYGFSGLPKGCRLSASLGQPSSEILDDLPLLVSNVIAECGTWFESYLEFLGLLKLVIPTRIETNEILMASAEQGVISSSQIMQVWKIFNHPTFPEYGTGSFFTLHSSITEILKSGSPITLPRKTIVLDTLFRNIID